MTDYVAGYQPPAGYQPAPPPPEPVPVPEQQTPSVASTPQSPPENSAPIPPAPQTNQTATTEHFPGVEKPMPEELVVEWKAMSRPHKKRNRQYFTTIAILVFLISLILFFAGQLLPIAVVLAIGFLVYVLEMVPPGEVVIQITTYGIRIEDTLYYWDEMGRFWYSERYDQTILHIEIGRFPGRLTVLIGDLNKDALAELLSEVLLMEKPKPTFFEEASERLQKLIPLE